MKYKIDIESTDPRDRLAYYGIVTIPYQGERRRVHATPPCETRELARQYAEQWVRLQQGASKKALTPKGK